MRNEEFQDFLNEYKQGHMPVVLTPAEAMDILGVGKNTMYRLLNSGQLKGVRVGRCWKILINEIEEFLMYNTNRLGN